MVTPRWKETPTNPDKVYPSDYPNTDPVYDPKGYKYPNKARFLGIKVNCVCVCVCIRVYVYVCV